MMNHKSTQPIYWSLLELETWSLYMAATAKGLCYVGSLNKPFEEMENWVAKRFPGAPLLQNDAIIQPYKTEVMEYLQGKLEHFSIPFDYHGTDFQLAVWNALCQIPYGETKTYSDIAHFIQKPSAVRAVGTAIGANPILISVPCHRVIGKNGSLTGYRGGLEMKTRLLEIERKKQN
jgi:methylated-DNA-[protein]-cysteine S-methyltransferase